MRESRRFFIRLALGGGADTIDTHLLMFYCGRNGVGVFVCSWVQLSYGSYLKELAIYSLLSFISNVLLLLVTILFFWAKSASLLNRPQSPLPKLEVSEEIVTKAADEMQVWINYALSIAHDIAIGGNLRRFIQVALSSWIISYIGRFSNLLTLLYICILLSLSLPLLYDKHQNQIDAILGKILLSDKNKKIK